MEKELKDFIETLKKERFDIYIPAHTNNITYCHFVKNDNIGYVQYDRICGFSFSSIHHSNQKTGTGFNIHREIINPTVSHAYDCFVHYPAWASSSDKKATKKYRNWDDFINVNTSIHKIKI
jgi:hypothetical protein